MEIVTAPLEAPRVNTTSSPEEAGEVAEAYFTCMRNGDPDVAALFHDDAQLIGLGTIVSGRPARCGRRYGATFT